MNYIVTRNREFFQKIGNYNLLDIRDIKPFEGRIALDTETTGLKARHNEIFCVQVGTGKDNYIFDLQDHSQKSGKALKIYLKEVWPLINSCEWVLQNAVFDLGFFYQNNLFPPVVFDTFIGSKILHNGEHASTRHDFGTLMKRHLNITYDKTDQKNIHKVKLSQPSTIEYAFNDVDKLLELHDVIYKKLERYGAKDSYLLHSRYIRGLAYMEQCGLPISYALWLRKMDNDKLIADQKQQDVIHYIFDHLPQYRQNQLSLFDTDKKITVLLSSPKQMIPVFKAFKINVLDKDGKESIEEGVIASSKHEFVKLWLEYNKAVHSVTTFGKSVLDKIEDGRIYTVFNPILDTARISTRSGEINFLNFPRGADTRKCFVANPGYQMVCSDYEGQIGIINYLCAN
jgi:DNA polymerase I-like protein with 3'-5' exonuclease and polymerase domains